MKTLLSCFLSSAFLLTPSAANLLADTTYTGPGGPTNTPVTLDAFGDPPGPFEVSGGGNPDGALVITEAVNNQNNFATFDQSDPGLFDASMFSFDFKIDPVATPSADGISFSYADVGIYGAAGGLAAPPFTPEDPAAGGVLGFGFDTWSNQGAFDDPAQPTGTDYNDISVFWNGNLIDRINDTRSLNPSLTLDDGEWHRVEGMVDFAGATVDLSVDGNVIHSGLPVPGLVPMDSRIMLAGRTGGENEDAFIDNINVNFIPEPTAGFLALFGAAAWIITVRRQRRPSRLRFAILPIGAVFAVFAVQDVYGQIYLDPGWIYLYDGGSAAAGSGGFTALDGSWSHDNGSDEWDGTAPGTGYPGGAVSIDGYLRIQETGDPRDYGFSDPGSNRKVFFGHDISAEGAGGNVLDTGVTLSFRARIPTSGALDDLHPDGGAGTVPYPANGDGYLPHDGGKSSVGLVQSDGGSISFALANDVDTFGGGPQGLYMNNLNGSSITGDVDPGDAGTLNVLGLDPTAWHEFWITIEAGGTGTHQVDIYADGSLVPTTFDVTAGSGNDFGGISYIAMGQGSTGQSGAIDIDYVGWTAGVIQPQVPEPSTAMLSVLGVTGLVGLVRRRRKA